MFFLPDPLVFASASLVAFGQPVCKPDAPTQITVEPKSLDVKYDYGKSLEQIQRLRVTNKSPYEFDQYAITQGLMRGSLKMEPRITIKHVTYPSQGQGKGKACAWFEKINVLFEIDPTIMIAREVRADACMYRAVREHELKHVKIDRDVMNKYADILGKRIYSLLDRQGFDSGMVEANRLDMTLKAMQKAVNDVADNVYQSMSKERLQKQSALDNKYEYERVAAQCPNFRVQQLQKPKERSARPTYYLNK